MAADSDDGSSTSSASCTDVQLWANRAAVNNLMSLGSKLHRLVESMADDLDMPPPLQFADAGSGSVLQRAAAQGNPPVNGASPEGKSGKMWRTETYNVLAAITCVPIYPKKAADPPILNDCEKCWARSFRIDGFVFY